MFDPAMYQGDFRLIANQVEITPGVWTQAVQPNSNRVVLYVSAPPTIDVYLNPLGVTLSTPPCFIVPANNTIGYTWLSDGFMPTLGFQASCNSSGGPTPVTFTEVWFNPGGE